jgi:hypothetical protein
MLVTRRALPCGENRGHLSSIAGYSALKKPIIASSVGQWSRMSLRIGSIDLELYCFLCAGQKSLNFVLKPRSPSQL